MTDNDDAPPLLPVPRQVPLRLQAQAEHMHKLGPRPIGELLLDLQEAYGFDLEPHYARFAPKHPGELQALGADQFPCRIWRVK